jgi:hypothetical protein
MEGWGLVAWKDASTQPKEDSVLLSSLPLTAGGKPLLPQLVICDLRFAAVLDLKK